MVIAIANSSKKRNKTAVMILPATIDSVLTQKILAIYNSKSNKRFQLHQR